MWTQVYWGWTSTSYLKNWIFRCLKTLPTTKYFKIIQADYLANYVLDAAMDIPREVVLPIENNFFGGTLVFIKDEQWVFKSNDSLQPSFKHFLFQKKLQKDFFGELKNKRNVRNQPKKNEAGN